MNQHLAALLLALGLALVAVGCGEDGPAGASNLEEAAPDNDGVTTPQELLAELHRRLTTGDGLYDQTWQDDVRRVAEAIWPADDTGAVPGAGRVHFDLAGIAGSTARYVLRDDEEGRSYLEANPEDKVVHDAYLAAVVTGADGYQTWCESKGPDVLATWKRTRRERILDK